MLVTSTLASTVIAQGVTIWYTIHIDFFAYSCSLDITKVSLYDLSGHLLGVATSPYGAEIAFSIRTQTPVTTLTATAYGQATWSSYYSWQVIGSGTINLGSTGDYWITIRMN
jgi:hypothetical protein